MKKLTLIIISVALLLSGCKEKSDIKPITSGVAFVAEISYNNETYEFSVEINKGNETTLKSLSSSLPDFSLVFSGENVLINYNSLNYQTKINALPDDFKVDLIHSVFLDASKNKANVLTQNDLFFLSGDTPKYKYKIHFGSSGLPIKIIDSNSQISIILKNARVL